MIAISSLFYALAITCGLAVWRAWYNGRENVAWFIWAPLTALFTLVAVGDGVRQLFFGAGYVAIGYCGVMVVREYIARHRPIVTDFSADDTVRMDGVR